MGIIFPCHFLLWWGLMEISMNFHGFGDYLCCWRLFVLETSPKLPYWTPDGQGWSADSRWRLWQGDWLIWRSRPYAIYGKPCAFEGQGWSSDHPVSIPFTLSFWSGTWRSHTKSVLDGLANIFLQKLIPKVNGKMFGIQLRKHCLLWAQVRKFTFS